MSRKKILYVESNTDGTVGGSHFSLLFLIEGLNKEIYEPIVAFYQKNYLIPRYERAGCKVIKMNKTGALNILEKYPILKKVKMHTLHYRVIVKPLIAIQKAINYLNTFIIPSAKCWRILTTEGIELVHLNNTISRPQEWILASIFAKTKVIAHERGINVMFPTQSIFWSRYLRAIICISDAVKSNLIRKGINDIKLFRIYNGLDPEKFKVNRSREDVFAEFGISNGVPVIGIIGNIKRWKGQETVLYALKIVKEFMPHIRCMIIGDVAESDRYYLRKLEDIVKIENIEENIIFTGPRKDIPDLLNCMSLLIHASIEPEPFGRTLLEGMALRKPIISTNIGAPREIIIDGETGILVTPGKPEEIAWAIKRILSDNRLAEKMGEAGYKRLVKEFNIRKNVVSTESIYSVVLS